MGKPLQKWCNNLHLLNLVCAMREVRKAEEEQSGDFIDNGLRIIRFLDEAGYEIHPKEGNKIDG